MKADLQFEFLVDAESSTITVRREFAAKRQLVWDCYTKSDLLDQWFAPPPLTTRTKAMAFRERGSWHYVMTAPDGEEFWGLTQYLTIDPIDGYTAVDGFADASGAMNTALPIAGWDVSFLDAGDHTVVRTVVSYESAEDIEKVVAMGMEEGVSTTLERLDALLATMGN